MASQAIATVAAVIGTAFARNEQGEMRAIKAGDVIMEGEVLVTPEGSAVELSLMDGSPLTVSGVEETLLTPDVVAQLAATAQDAAANQQTLDGLIAELRGADATSEQQQIQQALEGDGTLDNLLEATAAGLTGGGQNEGHSFVVLDRVNETVAAEGALLTDGAIAEGTQGQQAVVNLPPEVTAVDLGAMEEDGTITFTAEDLLVGSSDPEGTPLTVSNVVLTSGNGTLVDNGDGTYTFTPDPDWNGSVSFDFDVSDDLFTVPNTAALDVTPVNDAPEVDPITIVDTEVNDPEGNPVVGILEDSTIIITEAQLIASATDIDNTSEELSVVNVTADNGTITDNGDGTYTFTPDPDFNGEVTVNFEVSDGELSDTGSTTFTVVPVVDIVDDALQIDEDTPVIINVLNNDEFEGEGTVTSVTGPSNGTATVNADNTVTYVPNQDFVGEDTFTYTVTTEAGNTETATVTVTIVSSDNPANLGSGSGEVSEGGPLTDSGTISIDDPDAGENAFQVQTGTQGDYGSFNIDVNGNWTYTLDDSLNAVQALGVGDQLTEIFTVNSVDGTATSVVITINGTNDVPTITGDTGSVTEDTVLSTSGAVTIDDTDAGQSSFVPQENTTGTYGSFTLAANGAWTYTLDNASADVQALGEGDTLTESFAVTSFDGTATDTVVITINGTNDVPVFTPGEQTLGDDAGSVFEDEPLSASGTVAISDTDTDEEAFVAEDSTGDYGDFTIDENGDWTYNLDNNNEMVQALAEGETLEESFTVTTVDGSQTEVVITITGRNDAPVISVEDIAAVEDGEAITGNAGFTDLDVNNTHTYTVSSMPAGQGSVSIDAGTGEYTYNPGSDFQSLADGGTTTVSFDVTVTDNDGGSDTETVTVTITGTNDDPILTVGTLAATEDGVSVSGTASFTDVDTSNTHTYTVSSMPAGQGSVSIDAGTGEYTYNPGSDFQSLAAGETTTVSFDVTVTDNDGGSDTETVTVTITGTNDDPILTVGSLNANEDGASVSGTASFTDVDTSNTHTYSVSSMPAGQGSVSIDAGTGEYTYNPGSDFQSLAAGETTTVSFDVTVTDNDGGSDTETVTVTITGTNDDPILSVGTLAATEDGVSVSGTASFTDVDTSNTHTYTVSSMPAGQGSVSIDAGTGEYTYNPGSDFQSLAAGETTTVSFDVTVTDNDGGSDTETVTVTITGTNDAPTVEATSDVTGSVTEAGIAADGSAVAGTAQASGTLASADVDDDASASWTRTGTETSTYGTFTLNTNGTWTYDLDGAAVESLKQDETITETYAVQVSDGLGGVATETVTITINGTNDAPTVEATSDVTGSVTEAGIAADGSAVAGTAQASGTLASADVDDDASASWTRTGTETSTYGTFTLNTNGTWTYDLDGAAVESLKQDETITETYAVQVSDGLGGVATETVTITINGTNDAPTVEATSDVTGSVTEAGIAADGSAVAGTAQASGTLASADVDDDASASWTRTGTETSTYGTFTLNTNGTWTYDLDGAAVESLKQDETITETYAVQVSDGLGGVATETVTITINGTNDAPTVEATSDVTGSVTEAGIAADGSAVAGTAQASGTLASADVDDDASASWTRTGTETSTYGTFTLNTNGTWTYDLDGAAVESLKQDETITETYAVQVSDGLGGVATETVTITINGTNDAPTVEATSDVTGSVTEAGIAADGSAVAGTAQASGTLASADVDDDASASWTRTGTETSTYGTFTLNTNGTWTYDLDGAAVESLKQDETITETYAVQVSDGLGGVATETVTITINGTNDAPTVEATSDVTGSVTEAGIAADGSAVAGTAQASGTLASADVDDDASASWTRTGTETSTYGTFTLNTNGTWTYDLDGAAVESLKQDETITETYAVQVSDGLGGVATETVTITINGTNDEPVAVDDYVGVYGENEIISLTTADLLSNDTDTDGDSLSITSLGNAVGGTVSIDASGNVVFNPDEVTADGQASFDYTVSDGHGGTDVATVTMDINNVPITYLNGAAWQMGTYSTGGGSNQGYDFKPKAGDIVFSPDGDIYWDLVIDLNGGVVPDIADVSVSGINLTNMQSTVELLAENDSYAIIRVHVTNIGESDVTVSNNTLHFKIGLSGGLSLSNTMLVSSDTFVVAHTDGSSDYDLDENPDLVTQLQGMGIFYDEDGLSNSINPDDTSTNQIILGRTGSDIIFGEAGDDVLLGERDNDQLFGGEGADTLVGNTGDDQLTGGLGDDFFAWTLSEVSGHQGTTTDAAQDTITDFASVTNDDDVIRLTDLFDVSSLTDLNGDSSIDNTDLAIALSDYLNVEYIDDGNGNTATQVSIATDGSMIGGVGNIDQVITLTGVDLLNGSTDTTAVLTSLLNDGKLIID